MARNARIKLNTSHPFTPFFRYFLWVFFAVLTLFVFSRSGRAQDAATDSKQKNKEESPLDYAVVKGGSDLPADLSEEKRRAKGTGKVPIHTEGEFESPFAHPHFGGPAHIKVGLVISSLRNYDIQNGSAETTFFLSLTSDKNMPKIDLDFPNGHEVSCENKADLPSFKFFHCSGTFLSDVDLRNYPFDTQTIEINIEDKTAGVDQIIFEPDSLRTSLDSKFHLSSWSVRGFGAKAYKHLYPSRFDRDDLYLSRYQFQLQVDRFPTSAAFSVFVPAYIIVLISLIGLWCPPGQLEIRSNAGAPMLAAAVLFHFSLNQALPSTAYLTRADKLMLGVYISLVLNMISTAVLLAFDKQELFQSLWFKRFRFVLPPLTVLAMALASIV